MIGLIIVNKGFIKIYGIVYNSVGELILDVNVFVVWGGV